MPATDPKDYMTGGAESAQYWDEYARRLAEEAQRYATDNPYSKAAQPWIESQLRGDMATNPWMRDLYRDIGQANPYGTLDWLADYAGVPNGGQGTPPGVGGRPATGGTGGRAPSAKERMRAQYGMAGGRSGGGGGGGRSLAAFGASEDSSNAGGYHGGGGGSLPRGRNYDGDYVPDTITGSDSFFANQMRALMDAKTLDPANDPTLQPVIDAIQREAKEDYLGNLAGLEAQLQGAGRYGGGLYQAMIGQQTEEQQEAVSQAIAQQLMGAYQAQRERQMQGLGLVNQRDLAAMQDMTQREAIDAQSRAAGAASAAAAKEAAEQRKLQAASMLLGSQMQLMGMRGDMAQLMQQGQLGAGQLGLGYGELGMSGFNTALNAGQLGLGAAQLGANIGQGIWGMNQQEQQARWQRQFNEQQASYNRQMNQLNGQQDALNDYLNILMGIGGMGSSGYGEQPGQYVPYMDPNAAMWGGIGGGAMEGMGAWMNWNSGRQGGRAQ